MVAPLVAEREPSPASVQVIAAVLPASEAVKVTAAPHATTRVTKGLTVNTGMTTPGLMVMLTLLLRSRALAVSVAVSTDETAAGGL
jgi:hypothetical protein